MKSPLLGDLNKDLKIFGIVTKLQTNKWSNPRDQESNWIYWLSMESHSAHICSVVTRLQAVSV